MTSLSLSMVVVANESSNDHGNADSLLDAVTNGKPLLQLKMRYEHVEQANKPDNANAWTLRTLLGWQTKPFHDVSATVQLINVAHLTEDFYDNAYGRGLPSDTPTVQDPEITDINQLFIDYTGLPQTRVRLGRQIVQLDNVRYIGDVIFRQAAQVFDGISVVNQSLPQIELMAAHFERLRQTTTSYRDTHLSIAHAAWKFSTSENLTGYGYFQDQATTGQNTGFSDNSNRILGLRLDGKRAINTDWKLLYTAEYAKQDDYQQGDSRIDAHYARLGGGADWHGWYARLDREILSSNQGRYGFQTPLATLHPFQGWSDLFTTTPKQGMVDDYLSVGGKVLDLTISTEWHRFNADTSFVSTTGSRKHFGSEWDVLAIYPINTQWLARVEYANFKEGAIYGATTAVASRKRDTEKMWFTLMFTY